MSYMVQKNGKKTERFHAGDVRLAELLTEEEYDRVSEGTLVALGTDGALLDLSSPLADGQEIVLRPPCPESDFKGFGFSINSAGEVVGISELMAIRKYEEENDIDLYEMSLEEIRGRLCEVECRLAPKVNCFFDAGLSTEIEKLRETLECVAVGRPRHLPVLGGEFAHAA